VNFFILPQQEAIDSFMKLLKSLNEKETRLEGVPGKEVLPRSTMDFLRVNIVIFNWFILFESSFFEWIVTEFSHTQERQTLETVRSFTWKTTTTLKWFYQWTSCTKRTTWEEG
jgi:hypothetical protein